VAHPDSEVLTAEERPKIFLSCRSLGRLRFPALEKRKQILLILSTAMSTIAVELLVLLVLVLANGLFAMSEIAIVSARRTRLQQLANRGNLRAAAALDLANSPNRFLSTVQVGISLIGVLAGALGGATLANKLDRYFSQFALLQPYSQALSIGLVVIGITYLSLILGELVPKRLALQHPERIATAIAYPMQALSRLAAPIVHLLSNSTELVLKLFGVGAIPKPEVTEEEIKVLLQLGTEAGMFDEAEQAMIERVFRLGDQRVSGLMSPRPDIVWLDLNAPLQENCRKMLENVHSRFPVCQGSLDNVLGILQVSDLLAQTLNHQPIDLTDSLRQPLFVPESTHAFKVLEFFKQSSLHLALVVDEYGVIQGIVTLNDIMEAIIGDIPSISTSEASAIQREDGSWLLDGMIAIEEFKQLFNLEEMEAESQGNYHTLGGFVIMKLGRIPKSADHFEWQGLRFEVMDMDGNRVDKMLVMPIAKTAKTAER